MKKGWKIGIGAAVIGVTAVVVAAAFQNSDKRVEAWKGMQHFFEVNKASELNQYLDYCSFEDMFYKKDMQVSGDLYAEVGKITVKSSMEGTIDKSHRMVKLYSDVGVGGIPFAEFDLYSDDTNLYLSSEIFKDKMLTLDYKQDLYEVGCRYGISHRNMTMLQKGYTGLFQMAVSQSKNEWVEELLKNKQLRKDLLQIYKHMKVEKQENPDKSVGGYLYHINLKAEDVRIFLNDLCVEYPKIQENGYLDLANLFVSEERGVEITEIVNDEGFTSELSLENSESGWQITGKRREQEREGQSGFESSFGIIVRKDGNGIVNGEINLDYSAAAQTFQLSVKEDITKVSAKMSGIINADSKKGMISIDTQEIQMNCGNREMKLYGNTQIVFADYELQLPEETQVDVIHADAQELSEIKSEFLQGLKGIVGSAFKQFLGKLRFNF